MPKIPGMIPVSDLRQEAAAVLKRVQASDEPLVITQRGRSAAILLSLSTYERGERERELLRLLLRGEEESASHAGYALDEILADADALLSDQPL